MDNNRGFSEISASLEENWGRADNWRKGKNIVVSAYRQRGVDRLELALNQGSRTE
ncbi:MAG: hypothetical protein MK319_05865 [Pseudomonadales bacterium]|nr:hypothetical protein [Pseudomonadales bacterium]